MGGIEIGREAGRFGAKPVQEEKFVEISTRPTFFSVFTGNLREKRNLLRFLQISLLYRFYPKVNTTPFGRMKT